MRPAIGAGLLTLLLLCLAEALCLFLIPAQPPLWLSAMIAPGLFKPVLMIAVAGVMTLWALLLWLVTRQVCRKGAEAAAASAGRRAREPEAEAPTEQEQRLHHDKKLFLHLLSVLQTEGRLLDFLNEDLDRYEDGQIGATARGIHERCKRSLAKYVTLQPLSRQEEGDKVTVPPGFDPGAYRLSGNVTGDPPLAGKLVHKGWRAGRLNMPGFAFSGDPEIIAPMEVNLA